LMLNYPWSRLLRKFKGSAVLQSGARSTSKVKPASNFLASSMDRHSFIGYDCEMIQADIGASCSIANYVVICAGRHPIEWACNSPVFYEGREIVKAKFSTFSREQKTRKSVGSDVGTGCRAVVIQDVNIGHVTAIGAGSVVTPDVPPYPIVAGRPASVIRFRFDEVVRRRLLESKWWTVNDKYFTARAQHIRDPRRFANEIIKCA